MMIKFRYTAVAHTTMFGPHWFPYLLIGMLKDYKRHYILERRAEHLFSQSIIMEKKTTIFLEKNYTKVSKGKTKQFQLQQQSWKDKATLEYKLLRIE